MNPDRISLLIQKLRDQTASNEEKEELRVYLAQEDMDVESLLPWSDWEQATTEPMPSGLRDRLVSAVLERDAVSEDRRSAVRGQKVRRIPVTVLTAAAVVLLVIAMPWLFSSRSSKRTPASVTQVAARGQSRMVVLPDRSRVYLNGGSSITYPEVFDDSDRMVVLTGEAFFEVATIARQPFKVLSGSLLTTVLGTSFNVRAVGENVVIAVKTGKVKVASCVLLPGQQASYSGNGHALALQTVATDKIASWLDNELSFDGSPLKEILQTLENRYNVRLEPEAGVSLEEKYSITFYHLDLQESLDKIALLGQLKFNRRNDSLITITSK
jgi:ferric-dicitrate binding protein FerR (iron transport regulator)